MVAGDFELLRQRIRAEREAEEAQRLADTPSSVVIRSGDTTPTVDEALELTGLEFRAANELAAQQGPIRLKFGSGRDSGQRWVVSAGAWPGVLEDQFVDPDFLRTIRKP